MKSILWILNGCGLEGRNITGGPVRFHEISRRFAEFGWSQHVLTTPGGKTLLATLGCDLPMTVVPASLFLRREPCKPFRFWSYLVTSALWSFRRFRLPESDVLITVSDYFCDIVPALSLKCRWGAKWIAWNHHCEAPPRTRPDIGRRLFAEVTYRMQTWSFGQIARHADSAWVLDTADGDETTRHLLSSGMHPARIRRMKNGINFDDIRQTPEPPEKTVDAVMIGVRPNKGLHDIIPVWERVTAIRPGTTLTLMGGMDGTVSLEAEIRERNLPIELFRPADGGFLFGREYYGKIKAARLLFAPTHEEPWGIAVCEAMAAGLPVVAYDLPIYRSIYPDSATTVPCFDFDAFASRVVEVLEDGDFANRLRRKSLACAARYDWSRIAAEDAAAL